MSISKSFKIVGVFALVTSFSAKGHAETAAPYSSREAQAFSDVATKPYNALVGQVLRVRADLQAEYGAPAIPFKPNSEVVSAINAANPIAVQGCVAQLVQKASETYTIPSETQYQVTAATEWTNSTSPANANLVSQIDLKPVSATNEVKPSEGIRRILCVASRTLTAFEMMTLTKYYFGPASGQHVSPLAQSDADALLKSLANHT